MCFLIFFFVGKTEGLEQEQRFWLFQYGCFTIVTGWIGKQVLFHVKHEQCLYFIFWTFSIEARWTDKLFFTWNKDIIKIVSYKIKSRDVKQLFWVIICVACFFVFLKTTDLFNIHVKMCTIKTFVSRETKLSTIYTDLSTMWKSTNGC